jgi:trimeric autotransporter adhesin
VLVAGAGIAPAGVAAASGGASVASGAWATKLAAAGWTTKLAVAAVASAVIAAPTAVLMLSPRAPVEDGSSVTSARQHPGVAHAVAVTASEGVGATAAPALVPSANTGEQPPAVAPRSTSVNAAPKARASLRAASDIVSGEMGTLSLSARTASGPSGPSGRMPSQPLAARVSTGVQTQPAAPSAGPRLAPEIPSAASAVQAAPDNSAAPGSAAIAVEAAQAASAIATSSLQPSAATSARLTPTDDASAEPQASPQPSAASEPAPKFYAGRELTRPQLAGVRRRPASELARETQLIERALAALRVDDVPAARSWLNLHAARYPDGLLSRDRERVLQRIEESARARRAGRASAEHDERQ